MGGDTFLKAGHPDAGGSKLICLSGHTNKRGVFEIPLGRVTLRDIIYDPELGNGIANRNADGNTAGGKRLKFFHLGGQSGFIGRADQLDTVYNYTELKRAGLSVGSGAIVVMDESVSIIEYLKGVSEFFIHESCGKCNPCREGNRQVLNILKNLSIPGAATTGALKPCAASQRPCPVHLSAASARLPPQP